MTDPFLPENHHKKAKKSVVQMLTEIKGVRNIKLGIKADSFCVDWGDGINNNKMSHLYAANGSYSIKIKAENLVHLCAFACGLTGLKITRGEELRVLECGFNKLTCLSVKELECLEFLECVGNNLKKLDVRKCRQLKGVNCNYNHLEDLKLAGCKNILRLLCKGNRLKQLDLIGCERLERLDCSMNFLTAPVLDKLAKQVPFYRNGFTNGVVFLGENPGTGDCLIGEWNLKGWNVEEYF